MLTIINLFIISELLSNLYYFCDSLISQLELTFIFEIITLGVIILMSNRIGEKVLKGLQGTASTTIIASGLYDAYKTISENNSKNSTDNNNSGNNNTENDNNQSNNNSGGNNSNNNSNSNNSGAEDNKEK
jgi:hypothetical protein